MLKKRFSNKFPSNISMTRNERVYNPEPKKGRNVDSPRERSSCGKFAMMHLCECLVGTNSCYGCGKSDHMVNDFPNLKG